MTRLYLLSMVSVVLLDLFDKLFERYGIVVKEWDPIPTGPFVMGRIEGLYRAGVRCDPRFLIVRIPFVKTWGITNWCVSPMPAYGFRSHRLMWVEGLKSDPYYGIKSFYGWRIEPPLE